MERRLMRRQYFIDRKFQTGFIVKFAMIVLTASLVTGFAVIAISRSHTTVTVENSRVLVKDMSDLLFPIMVQTLIIVNIFAAISAILLTLFISHKISGPLYRIKSELDRFKKGDLTVNFKIRSNDQLQDLSRSLVEVSTFFRDEQSKLLKKTKRIKEIIAKSPNAANEEIKEVVDEIDNIVGQFKM